MSQKEEPKAAEVVPKKSSPALFTLLLPALLAGAAAFGGVKFSAAHAASAPAPALERAIVPPTARSHDRARKALPRGHPGRDQRRRTR